MITVTRSTERLLFRVEGMSCEQCRKKIEMAVNALPGVKEARTSLDKKEVEVFFDSGRLRREELEKAITGAGYKVLD